MKLICNTAEDTDAKSACTGDACTSNISARGTFAGNTSFAVDACIKSAGLNGTCTKGVGKESACTEGADAVKYLRIYLRSFSILEVEPFNTGWCSSIDLLSFRYGSTAVLFELETGIRAGW